MDKNSPVRIVLAFIQLMKQKDVLVEDAKKFLTLTQQSESKFVGRTNIEGALRGFHSLLQQTDETYSAREIHDTNPLRQVVVIKINSITDSVLREKKIIIFSFLLIKEIGIRSPHADGQWGININSFKLIN